MAELKKKPRDQKLYENSISMAEDFIGVALNANRFNTMDSALEAARISLQIAKVVLKQARIYDWKFPKEKKQ